MANTRVSTDIAEQLSEIAKKILGFPTLESRHSDSLDFRDVGVGSLKDALIEAFLKGQASADPQNLYSTTSNAVLLLTTEGGYFDKQLNPFTTHLKSQSLAQPEQGVLVKLRDGTYDKVQFQDKDGDGDPCQMFVSVSSGNRWTAQGYSVSREALDMVAAG